MKRGLPNVPNSQDRQQLQFQQAIKELVEIGEGVRGDPLDRKVTLRDLLGSGIARIKPGMRPGDPGNILPGIDGRPDMSTPPKPSGVVATPGLGTIFITWDSPRYSNHGYARIYRAGEDNFANAAVIGTAAGTMYVDNLHGSEIDDETGEARTYFYWVVFVSEQGVEGPPHDVNGVSAAPAMDPEYVLKLLEGRLTESQLHEDLTTRLTKTDETIIEQKEKIDGLSASYTVKIDANGRVAGYGLSSEPNKAGGNTSRFIINADQFGIFHPSASQQLVFGVFNGKTVMDGAYIRNGTIGEAQIGDAAINRAKIAHGEIQSAHIGDAQIGSAKFANIIQSDNYSATKGWAIYRNGIAYFRDIYARGDIEASSLKANSLDIVGEGHIKDLSVSTLKIKGQAVTIPSGAYYLNKVYVGNPASAGQLGFSNFVRVGTAYRLASLYVNSENGRAFINFLGWFRPADFMDNGEPARYNPAHFTLEVRRGNTVVQSKTYSTSQYGQSSIGWGTLFMSWIDESPGNITQEYSVWIYAPTNGAYVQERTLTVIGLKR